MKERNEDAYLPVAVEIGLFTHYRQNGSSSGGVDRDYSVLEDYKCCCVRRLIGWHHLLQEPARTPELLRRCLHAMKSLEPRIMASYPPRTYSGRFVYRQGVQRGMMLDGCFVLHRLLKYAAIARKEAAASSSRTASGSGGGGGGGRDDEEDDDDWTQVLGRCWVWGFVTCDLLLLENQIPFFVVEKLFKQLRTDPDETSDVLVAGALRLFSSLRPRKLYSSHISRRDVRVHHLLHLFYLSVGFPADAAAAPAVSVSRDDDPRRHVVPPSELSQWIPSARELEEAGVAFRPRKGATSFLDVRFDGGNLEIPELQLYDYSESLFRNLIAFEQTYPFTPGHVTAYAIFMDCLITSPEDVRLLHLSGVLVNQMSGGGGERDAAGGFFGRLCAEAHLAADRNYLAGVIREVNRYQRSRWPRWRAALVRNYFSNPWVATSFVPAVILLALTMLQSFFAVYAYVKPPKQP